MDLFHTAVFEGKDLEVQTGWNFFKGSLEIKNPDGSTSLFGHIKNSIGAERVTLYDGYLNNLHPHFLKKDFRKDETSNYFLLTIVSDGFVDMSQIFTKSLGYIRIGPKRKKDKSLVLITLCLHKYEDFKIKVKNPHDGKIREIAIGFSGLLGSVIVEDITPIIKRPTLTLRAVRFLKRLLIRRCGGFMRYN